MTEDRLLKLRYKLEKAGLDAILVSGRENRRYLSGFRGSAGCLLITSADNYLVTDFRYATQSKKEAQNWQIIISQNDLFFAIAELIREKKIKTLGVEKHILTISNYEKLQNLLSGCDLVPMEGLIEELRKQKDEQELKLMRQAAKITSDAFEALREYSLLNKTERETAHLIEELLWKYGGETVAFPTIVASGPHGALPHASPSGDIYLRAGDLVVMDFGATVDGYSSDLTRTVVVGEPTQEQKDLYSLVLEAQLRALQTIKEGVTGKQVDMTARSYLEEHGYGKYFGHGLGHGVGLEIHEQPWLSPSERGDNILLNGMAVTVEPGIYLPDWGGIRIEDTVVVQEDGCEILTLATKDLLVFY